MKQQVSDLMDGELDGREQDAAWRSLAKDDELRDCWRTYHLIGECMRGDASASRASCTEKIMARLADEPTVLAPRGKAGGEAVATRTRVALAMAASVATLGVVGMMASRQPASTALEQVAQRASVPVQQVANGAPVPQVNDYLALHRQYSNSAGIQQATLLRDVEKRADRTKQVGVK